MEITHSVQQAAAGVREVAQQIAEVNRQTGEADQLAGAVSATAGESREPGGVMDGALKQAVRAAVG